MASASPTTRGRDLALRLQDGCREASQAPLPGARDLPVVTGVTPRCLFVEPIENVLVRIAQILTKTERVFGYGDQVVYESVVGPDRRLVALARGGAPEPAAAATLANLMIFQHAEPGRDPVQFAPPQQLVAMLVNGATVRSRLPVIRTYATRPVFDNEFRLLGTGWHPEAGILVHGPDVEPILHAPAGPGGPALDRLPPRLRALLAGFCFRGAADVVAAVAAMLTGLLAAHFVGVGKALVLVDGNQPGLGKTLLARVVGVLLDGADPRPIHYTTDDEELAKRICAMIRGGYQSVVLVDNAKLRAGGVVSSPVLESNSMAPQVTLRILGQSANVSRPNDLVWFLTMNDTRTSPDLVSRGMPVRLRYEGDPRLREFPGVEPIGYATAHRAELLGELAGMVIRWTQAGRPEGQRRHRCDRWARVVGGILEVAGLTEFLANLDEAAASFNQSLDELAALAEAAAAEEGGPVIPTHRPGPLSRKNRKKDAPGLSPGAWEPYFRRAGLLSAQLEAAKSQQARTTTIGNFLSTNLGREVAVVVGVRRGQARLVGADAGQRQTRYAFEISWEGETPHRAEEPGPTRPGTSGDARPVAEVRAG
jgi:hypothetical protein